MGDAIDRSDSGGVAVLRMSRPPLNLFSTEMRDDLVRHIGEVATDDTVGCVVITGGSTFSAGADLKELGELDDRAAFAWNNRLHGAFELVAGLALPVVAAIGRVALGGGLELALCADFRVLSAEAILGQPEIELGMLPGSGGTQRLARLIGLSRAKDLLMSGRRIDAHEAERLGLVDEVAAPDQVLQRALARARVLAELPRDAMAAIKAAVDFGTQAPLATGLALERALFSYQFGSSERKQRFADFLNRSARSAGEGG